MDIELSARKHGIDDPDMMHAYRNHRKAFATDDDAVTMYVGPSRTGAPLEIGVHAMAARSKFLKGWWTP